MNVNNQATALQPEASEDDPQNSTTTGHLDGPATVSIASKTTPAFTVGLNKFILKKKVFCF
jgi:hypothetical protein